MKRKNVLKGAGVLFVAALMVLSTVVVTANTNEDQELTLRSPDKIVTGTGSREVGVLRQDIIWDNGGTIQGGGCYSSQRDECYPFISQVADDFMFDTDQEVCDVHWWGCFWNGPPDEVDPCDFSIYFYADDGTGNAPTGGGMPDPTSTALASYSFSGITGYPLDPNGFYEYDVVLDPCFQCAANTKYWIAIVAEFCYPPQWGWTNTDGIQLHSAVQGFPMLDVPFWTDIDPPVDMAFYLTGKESVSFSQLDWYYHGDPHTLNSMWGRMDIIADPDSSFWYMNVVADAGNGPAWIIQNYPIFPEEYGVPDEQVIYFNIENLGLDEGMPLEEICALITYDLEPQQTQPQGECTSYYVTTSIRDAWGHTIEIPETVGTPEGHIADGEVENATKHTNVPSVQEWHNNCITGSYARSIKWLDNEHDLENLPAGTSAQDIYDTLNESGVGHGSGQGKTEEEMLEIKAAYLKGLDGRAVTKFVDLTGWMSDNVTGCTEETPDNLKDWLENELKNGEDIELCYDSHCITITGIYTQGDKTFLEYRDDEKQGDDDVGDAAEKEGELTQVGGGWNFDGSQVDYVVSESINDPPDAPDIDGPTSGSAGTSYPYTFTSTDPNGDPVSYYIDWDDGTTPWTAFMPHGPPGYSESHTWSEQGDYTIKAKAKDIYGAESDWGYLEVEMPVNQPSTNQQLLKTIFQPSMSFKQNTRSPLTR